MHSISLISKKFECRSSEKTVLEINECSLTSIPGVLGFQSTSNGLVKNTVTYYHQIYLFATGLCE